MVSSVNRIWCFILVFLPSFGWTQAAEADLHRPEWSIKINPLAAVAYTPGIELGIEHRIAEHATMHLAASYLHDFNIYEDHSFEGYKALLEYRHFNLITKATDNYYTSFQVHFKQVFAKGNTYVDRAGGNYQQLSPVKATTKSYDFLIANGLVVPFKNRRFSVDLSMLYGVKLMNLDLNGLPEDARLRLIERNFFDFTLNQEGDAWFPVLRLQAKLNIEL